MLKGISFAQSGGQATNALDPKPSEIQNVLATDAPQQMLAKLLWEIHSLTNAMS